MKRNPDHLCECCSQVIFNRKSNAIYCKSCKEYITLIKNKFYCKISALKLKVSRLETKQMKSEVKE